MPTIDTKKLNQITNNTNISASAKKMIKNAAVELNTVRAENSKLKAVVKSQDKLKKEIATLRSAGTESKLKNNPIVIKLVSTEKTKLTKVITAKDVRIGVLERDLLVLKTQPIQKAQFNQFISQSVLDLQASFSKAGNENKEDCEILIRDVEIEASVITELKGGKPVYVIPSRQDMKELGSNNFQKIKYFLSLVPKE